MTYDLVRHLDEGCKFDLQRGITAGVSRHLRGAGRPWWPLEFTGEGL